MIISIFDWFSNLPMSCWWLFFICLWFVAAFVIFFGDKWLFGNKPVSKSDKFKYLGAFIGGTLVVLGAIFAQHQFKVQNCSKIEDQFYVRFDKASSSLFSGNSETAISLLHQLAVEASKSKDQSSYIEEIKKILIVFIKKNSIIKEDTVYNKIDKIQLQKIIDNLFRGEHHEIYSKYATDLSVTVLKDLNFLDAHLQGAIFSYAHLGRAYFVDAHLHTPYLLMPSYKEHILTVPNYTLQILMMLNYNLLNLMEPI